MSLPGWYRDPGGRTGHFRYWDGAAWSESTSANPGSPPPASPGGGPTGSKRTQRRTGVLIVTAAILVVIVASVFAVRALRPDLAGPTPVTTTAPAPGPATPEPAEPAPSQAAPSSAPNSDGPFGSCPEGAPESRQPHPNDGLVHGGGLSFPSISGWTGGSLPRRLSWAYDVGGQATTAFNGQPAMAAVGALATFDGFEVPEQAADAVLDCAVGTSAATRRDLLAEPVSIDGNDGWRIRSVLLYGTGATPTIDQVDVIVVDLGSPESLSMFWASAPADDQQLVNELDSVAGELATD